MSSVTNTIISFSLSENSYEEGDDVVYFNMNAVNDWLEKNGFGSFSVNIDVISGGKKRLECPLFVAAFNHIDIKTFCDYLRTLKWEEPENVQIFVKEQNDTKFKIIEPA